MSLLFILPVLSLVHGVGVLAEYAIVKTSTRPKKRSQNALYSMRLRQIHHLLDEYLMASQICRTAIVLCMGVILGGLLADGRSPISIETGGIPIGQYAVVITLTLLLHVVLGHEIPKQVAIDRADACAEMAIPYLRMSRILVFPFVWVILWLRPLLGSR